MSKKPFWTSPYEWAADQLAKLLHDEPHYHTGLSIQPDDVPTWIGPDERENMPDKETNEILADPEAMEMLRKSEEDIKAGRLTDHATVKADSVKDQIDAIRCSQELVKHYEQNGRYALAANVKTLLRRLDDYSKMEDAALELCRKLQCPAMEYLNRGIQDAWAELFNMIEPPVQSPPRRSSNTDTD
jgi:hypothetical protein